MPDIVIQATTYEPGSASQKFKISGIAYEEVNHFQIGWTVEVDYHDTPNAINAAMIQAAVDGFLTVDPPITVSPQDRKLLFCGAVQ